MDENPRDRRIRRIALGIGNPAVVVIENLGSRGFGATGKEKCIVISDYPAGVGYMGIAFFTAQCTSQAEQPKKKRTDNPHKMAFVRM